MLIEIVSVADIILSASIVVIFAWALLSWFPSLGRLQWLAGALDNVTTPLLSPFRRVLPMMAGMDFSPLLAIVVLLEVERLLAAALTGSASIESVVVSIIGTLLTDILAIFALMVLIRILLQLFGASIFHPLVLLVHQATDPLIRPFSGGAAASGRSSSGPMRPAVIALVVYLALYLVAQTLVSNFTRP